MVDYFSTIINRIGFKLANLIFFVIVGKTLNLNEMGSFGVFFSLALILSTIFDLGVRNTATFAIGQKTLDVKKFLYSANKYISILFLFLFSSVLFLYFIPLTSISNDVLPLLLCSVISLTYTRIVQAVFLGQEKILYYNKSESIARFCLLIAILILYFTNLVTFFLVCFVVALSNFVSALYTFFSSRSLVEKMGGNSNAGMSMRALDILYPLFRVGFYFMLSVLLMNLVKRIHVFYLSSVSIEQSGVFFGLFRVSEVFIEVALAVSVVLMSKTSSLKNIYGIVSKSAKAARICFFSALVSLPIIFLIPDVIITTLLRKEYINFQEEFQVICLGSFIGIIWTILFPIASNVITSRKLLLLMILSALPVIALYEIFIYINNSITLMQSSIIFTLGNVFITVIISLNMSVKSNIPLKMFFIPIKSDFRISRL